MLGDRHRRKRLWRDQRERVVHVDLVGGVTPHQRPKWTHRGLQ